MPNFHGIRNAKFSGYCFFMNTKAYRHIFKSPLKYLSSISMVNLCIPNNRKDIVMYRSLRFISNTFKAQFTLFFTLTPTIPWCPLGKIDPSEIKCGCMWQAVLAKSSPNNWPPMENPVWVHVTHVDAHYQCCILTGFFGIPISLT